MESLDLLRRTAMCAGMHEVENNSPASFRFAGLLFVQKMNYFSSVK